MRFKGFLFLWLGVFFEVSYLEVQLLVACSVSDGVTVQFI